MADKDTSVKLPAKAATEVGRTGTYNFKGYISYEEYNRELTGKNALKIYDIMRRSDATVRSMLQVCKLPILATTWKVEASEDDPNGQEKADFVQRELTDRNVNIKDLLRQALSMFDYGFSVFEKVYELTEFNGKPRIGLAKISPRKQTSIYRWAIQDGNAPGVTQQLITGEKTEMPMDKLLVFTNDKEGDNYEGISMLRYAYKDWNIKDKLTIVNAIALEKMAIGVPLLSTGVDGVDPGPAEIAEAEKLLRQFRGNEEGYLKKPKGMNIEMLDMKAGSTKDVIPTIQYHDRQIAKSVLAQFMELGAGHASGSRALSSDMTNLFMKSEEAAATTVASVIQEQLIKQLCDLNFTDMSMGYPKLAFGTIGDEDVTNLANAVSSLVTAGALTPDAGMENHLRNVARLPALPKEIEKDYDNRPQPNKALPAPADVKPTELPTETKTTPKQNQKELKASLITESYDLRSRLLGALAEG